MAVGQFESTAELMDQWLTWTWLEGGGGAGDRESYELALYFAARHLDLDCHRKRGQRGYLFHWVRCGASPAREDMARQRWRKRTCPGTLAVSTTRFVPFASMTISSEGASWCCCQVAVT